MSTENNNQAASRTRNHVAGGTVTWGVILLVVAGVAFAVAMFDITTVTPAVIGWAIVGIGALLVVAAIVGVVARAVRPRESAGPGVSTGSTTGGGSTSVGGSTTGGGSTEL